MATTTRQLDPDSARVTFENGTTLESAEGSGTVTQVTRARRRAEPTRSLEDDDDVVPGLANALRAVGMREQETVTIEPDEERSLRSAGPERVVLKPKAAPDGVQVVLYADESGGLSWHIPRKRQSRRATRSSGDRTRFVIDTRTTAARRSREAQSERGTVTKIGRKIFKVIVVPISKVIAKPVQAIVGKVERKHRQNLVRALTPDNYSKRVAQEFTDWNRLTTGKSLLVVHGIFSSTEGVLSQLPRDAMATLHQRYGGRVIAFDHLTVTQSPEDNARFFLRKLREGNAGAPIDFDILCHSRGGIVSRVLAERGRFLDPRAQCAFEKVYFVATPNAGSPLADPKHIVDMIDVFTNAITVFPDGPVTYSLEILLALVKLLVVAAETSLPGLAAMGTKDFIRQLNRSTARSPAAYASAAANYEPDPERDNGFFTGKFADYIVDRVFEKAANDIVVPRDGVFGDNGHPSFPITRKVVFGANDHVWHSGFFAEPRALSHMTEFLDAT